MHLPVIEISCGEYGDNIKKLVNAINNGKYDIRDGYPFPELKEGMNNCTASTGILKNGDNIEKIAIKLKDINDISNLEEKFPQDRRTEISNGKLISNYAANDITKQGRFSPISPYIYTNNNCCNSIREKTELQLT